MKKLTQIFISICLIVFFCTCRKYPEDEKMSFTSPLYRITKHKWKLILVEINGADSSFQQRWNGYVLSGKEFRFEKKKADNGPGYIVNAGDSWDFANGKRELIIDMVTHQTPEGKQVLPYGDQGNWKIVKLTEDDFILELTGNPPKSVVLKLKKL